MNGKWPLGLLSLVLLQGCASGTLSKSNPSNTQAQELPKELQQKFEVKETQFTEPAPAPSPIAQKTVASKKRRVKKPKPEPQVKPASADPASASASPSPSPTAFSYPSRRPQKDPIWVGERSVYEVTYFGMAAGNFTLQVQPYKEINHRKVYHVHGTAISSTVFNLFYRLDDKVDTFIDYDGLFSHRFRIELDETKQYRDSLELFDSEKGETYWWNRWDRKEKGYVETKEYHPIPAFSQDSLSALYYLRTQPLPDGAVLTFPVVSEGKAWEAVVTVVRREIMDTPMGKLRTVVLKPEHKFQGVLQNKGDSFVWLTDDDRRYLVRLEAKVKIGTVVARLKEVQPGNPPEAQPSAQPGAQP